MIKVKKRNGNLVSFDRAKIVKALYSAFNGCRLSVDDSVISKIAKDINIYDGISVESIQDQVEDSLIKFGFKNVAKAYIKYRYTHEKSRYILSRIDYMDKYAKSNDNASTSSETDANANVSRKNVANLEGEVYKVTNRLIQRQRMKDMLNKLYPDSGLAKQYIEDLESHIIYTHDEASSPVSKYYCQAVSLYPLMTNGVGQVDGVTPSAPNDIQSFSGQITNLTFLLSSQAKGATAYAGYFVALNYYVIAEFGSQWYNKLDTVFTNEHKLEKYTIRHAILKGMKQFIWGINQPAGNRSYNSPFTNVSWFDRYYFDAMYGEFYYPDGTKPEWNAIDVLQRMFMKLLREIRLVTPVTFPVTTMSLLYDEKTKEFKDKEYEKLTAEEYAKGGSFFTYMNSNPASLASCCRVLNEMDDNTFSSTTGMNGEMTGSCNVITINFNRIVQNWFRTIPNYKDHLKDGIVDWPISYWEESKPYLQKYLQNILDRVYKYHIAYKTILYNMEDAGMFESCNGNYIYMKKLYSTIGLIGYMEAAEFMGFKIGNNSAYKDFLATLLSTVNEANKLNSIHNKKRPFKFNSEAIPGENLGVKLYNWDKHDGYKVTEGRERYSCYFFNPWDKNTSVLDKIKLHGGKIAKSISGGQASHINLDAHLSAIQYDDILHIAAKEGCNYFTFNIPMSECKDCHHIVNAPIHKCPKCGSTNIRYYTRIIGYLRPVDVWSEPMQEEFEQRVFTDKTIKEINANDLT